MKIYLLALLAFLIVSGPVVAATFPDKPQAQDFFVDDAKIIKEQDRVKLNAMAEALLKEQQIPLFVVTINALSTYDASAMGVDGYAKELFNHWGIGSSDRNYGILLLVSVGDRKARIELGAGFGHSYDKASNDIMQTLLVPAFKRGDYSAGIVDGVRGLDAMARGLQLPMPPVPWWMWMGMAVGAIFIVAIIVNLFKSGKSGWAWGLIAGLAALLFLLSRMNKGSSGGFGGGSSGGGGAGGSW